mmetsp:Transcript_69327/g.167668  ORF Transcript_69327/g.167668 Transcript_69327/m.167668 type:complete len:202 (-) Transcript_69327:7-612(-)
MFQLHPRHQDHQADVDGADHVHVSGEYHRRQGRSLGPPLPRPRDQDHLKRLPGHPVLGAVAPRPGLHERQGRGEEEEVEPHRSPTPSMPQRCRGRQAGIGERAWLLYGGRRSPCKARDLRAGTGGVSCWGLVIRAVFSGDDRTGREGLASDSASWGHLIQPPCVDVRRSRQYSSAVHGRIRHGWLGGAFIKLVQYITLTNT